MESAFVWIAALTLRSTVVLSAALGLGWLLRGSSAAARHRILTLTAVSVLALPLLAGVLPRLELPIGSSGPGTPSPAPTEAVTVLVVTSEHGSEPSTTT